MELEILKLKRKLNVIMEILRGILKKKYREEPFRDNIYDLFPIEDTTYTCRDGTIRANKYIMQSKGIYTTNFPDNDCEEIKIMADYLMYGWKPMYKRPELYHRIMELADAHGLRLLARWAIRQYADNLCRGNEWKFENAKSNLVIVSDLGFDRDDYDEEITFAGKPFLTLRHVKKKHAERIHSYRLHLM